MLEQNKPIFDALGITHWHEAGYLGENGLTVTFERPVNYPIFNGMLNTLWTDISPVCEREGDTDQFHAYQSAMMHLQVAPKRKIVSALTLSEMAYDKFLPWMLENKPDLGFKSVKEPSIVHAEIWDKVGGFCSLFNSAGNDANNDYSVLMRHEAWWGVGSVTYIQGQYTPRINSSTSEYVDFASIGFAWIPAPNGTPIPFTDTSCAAPFLTGMCALVQDFFYQKIGRFLTPSELYQFVKENCVDIEAEGKDVKTGWGVFVLPPYESIDVEKYRGDGVKITMQIGSKSMYVDGKEVILDQPPIIDAGTNRTLIPVRAFAEALGCTVDWDAASRTITIIKEGTL